MPKNGIIKVHIATVPFANRKEFYENELKARPRKTRKIVSENLGHHRTEVTRIYLADKPEKK